MNQRNENEKQREDNIVKITPGSWPARTPKNPVVPTAVTTERYQIHEQQLKLMF